MKGFFKLLAVATLVAGCSTPVYEPLPAGVVSDESRIVYDQRSERFYYVLGEVKAPGPKQYLAKTTLTQAIQTAGGLTANADMRQLEISRPNGAVKLYDYRALTEKNDPPVFPGDKVRVLKIIVK